MNVLVTGGGYIGSVTVELLRQRGEGVVVLDNLSRGHRDAGDPDVPFVRGDAGDASLIAATVEAHEIDACMHFAGFAYAAESVETPGLYLENNVAQGFRLIEALARARGQVDHPFVQQLYDLRLAAATNGIGGQSARAVQPLRMDQILSGENSSYV